MGISWYQSRAARQDEGLRMGTLFEWLVNLGRYRWNSASVAICPGGAEPLNTPLEIERPNEYVFTDKINEDWRAMAADFDLVLMTSSSGTCVYPEGSDDPEWVKSSDEIVWEKICETYCELGLTVGELKMEVYNEGCAGWD